jgi:RNA polymerase sigma-70 factor (ECF subfamily)
VTQEVLSDAFRGLASYRGDARLSTWLFTLACRRVAGHYRSESRRPRASGHPGDASFPADPADHGWQTRLEDADRAARARRVIETLPEPTRTILVAYHVAELSVREIADELDLPEGSVKSHLHRGRLAVRRRMESP